MGDLSEVRPEGLVDAWPPCEHGVTGDPQWTGTRAEWEVSRLDGRGRPADLLCEDCDEYYPADEWEVIARPPCNPPREHDQPLPLPGGEPVLPHALRSIGALTEGAEVDLTPEAVASLRAQLTARIQIGTQRYGQELRTDDGRDAARDLREEALDAYLYAIRGWLQSEGERCHRYTMAAMHALCIWEALYDAEEEGE